MTLQKITRFASPTKLARICPCCDIEFFSPRSQVKLGYGIYCSRACSYSHRKRTHVPQRRPNKWTMAACKNCSKEFSILKSQMKHRRGKYCSRSCRTSCVNRSAPRLLGAQNPKWKGGKDATRERGKEQMRIYRLKHRQKIDERVKLWRQNNPEKIRAIKVRYKARKNNAPGEFTATDIKTILIKQGGVCLACAADLYIKYHIDHIKPLSKGGTNNPSNLQLLCPSCNAAKGAKNGTEYWKWVALRAAQTIVDIAEGRHRLSTRSSLE